MRFILFCILLLASSFATAQMPASLPDYTTNTQACSIYYLRHEKEWINLAMYCDGQPIFTYKAKTEEEMDRPGYFKYYLKQIFLKAVNSDGKKNCTEEQNKKRWWMTCKI